MNEVVLQRASAGRLRRFLNSALFDWSTREGRVCNFFIAALILAVVLVSMCDSVPALHRRYASQIHAVEFWGTVAFAIEYALRVLVANRARDYVLSFEGMVDALTILPLILFGQTNVLVRLLRLARLFKLFHRIPLLVLLVRSLRGVVRMLAAVLAGILLISLAAGNLIFILEPESFPTAFDGFWWSLVTMSTVGYGDIVPKSGAARTVAGILILLGISMFAMVTAVISARVARLASHDKECPECRALIDEISRFCPECGREMG